MTRQQQINALLEEYVQKQEAALRARDARMEEARRTCPEIAQLLAENAQMLREAARVVATRPALAAEESSRLKSQALHWRRRLQEALVQRHLPETYLDPSYTCPLCQDSGYLPDTFPRRFCSCFESALSQRLSTSSQEEQTFETFDLSIFPDEPLEGRGYSQRAMANRVYEILTAYCDRFPHNVRPNITFLGQSGLGKTFFCNCVAQRLRQKGTQVLQVTAFRMHEAIRSRNRFADEAGDAFTDMLNAPFLILDDLGSEPMLYNITIEYLFALLNERAIAGRPTIVATNFDSEKLREHYTERVSSRLLDSSRTVVIPLQGIDLRTRKCR